MFSKQWYPEMTNHNIQTLLRQIPGVDSLLEKIKHETDFNDIPLSVIKTSIREVLERIRKNILDGKEFNGKEFNYLSIQNNSEKQVKQGNFQKYNIQHDHPQKDIPLHAKIIHDILSYAREIISQKLVPTINATGVVLHTNLGRSLLCKDALDRITEIAGGFSNLEFNIKKGKRGDISIVSLC
ncbi:MAG: hypothetical protein HQK67_11865 [Desulfamplus sp.]|nr:hypothetical protein [Desulfamplus sp.]